LETTPAEPRSDPAPGLSPTAQLVRRHDRDRFQTALFAPAERREALFALYAFNYEIARVREAVSEPMLGQIRLQWWRDAIAAAYAGEPPRRHEVVLPLTEAIRERGLDRASLDRLVDARERDLNPEPPPSLAALEHYTEGSSAELVLLALETLGTREPEARAAARSVGIGYALAGLLRAMPFHARVGRNYIPAEIAAATGLDPADYAAGRGTPALRAAVAKIAAAAERNLAAARQQKGAVPRGAIAAVLPAVIAERYLKRLRRAGHDPFAPQLALPDPLQAWRLLAASLLRRY
jgi:phytoene synthase